MTRIALISDIHFGQHSRTTEFSVPGEPIRDENSGGKSLTESLIAVLKNANAQYLCIAGDLTSIASPQEFSYCEQAILSIAEKVGIPHERIILGLGNHDVDWKISGLNTTYEATHPEFPHDLVKDNYRKIAANASLINMPTLSQPPKIGPMPFTEIIENSDFVMFVLNTGCYCTKDQEFSHGKLGTEQIQWFESETKRLKDDPRWKIVLMHHHPFNYSFHVPGIDISTLEEGSQFLDIAGQNRVHLVLHGHRHHPKAETQKKNQWNLPITFICGGSLTVNSMHRSHGDIPNTLHLIELSDDVGALQLFNYQYSPSNGWIPIHKNCPETPLDYEMYLGKLFEPEEICESISKLPSNQMIRWRELDERLRFLKLDDLNERIKLQLSETHTMMGKFPENVILIPREGD